MVDSQSNADAGPPTPRVISAGPDGAEKQWNWTSDSSLHRVRIAHMFDAPFTTTEAASEKAVTHFSKSPTASPSCAKILELATDSDRGDIFTTALHTVFGMVNSKITALGVGGSQTKHEAKFEDMKFVFLAELLAALDDHTSPAAAVICGCGSAEFLSPIIQQTSVPVAVGISSGYDDIVNELGLTSNISAIDCSSAADAVTASLMNGETINQAVARGTSAIKSKMNRFPLVVVAQCASGVDADLSLKDNKLLPKFRK